MFLLFLPANAMTRKDDQKLTELLEEARDEALQLSSDAIETQTLVTSDSNWITHALMLERVKGHVDNMALIVDKLTKAQKTGSELQEQAVEQILPLIKELSANTTAAINYLKQNKARPISETYTRYLQANVETASQLSSIISALIDYEMSMTEIDRLRSKLAVL
jgi:Na+/phosphate symporter